jgi:type I restriction enzyme, S subunit
MKQGWEVKKLGEVCDFINRGISPKYIETNGVCVLNQKCIRDHIISFEQSRRHDSINKFVSPERFIQLGDVLVNSTGTGTLGRVAQVRETPLEHTTVDSHVTIVRPKAGLFSYDFFGYMLILIEEAIKEAGEGCGGQTELARSVLAEKFFVSFPNSIPEQQRIVSILDQTFSAIAKAKANAERNLQNAKELFESYLQSLYQDLNENSEITQLGNICHLISKGSSPNWQGIKYVDTPGVLFITSENVGENTLLLKERKYVEGKFNLKERKSILKNGDVLTNIVGASIGRTAIYNIDDIANINQAVCLIRCNSKFLINEYLMYLLNSPITKVHLHDNEVNNARANLSLTFFRGLSIPLPALNEQISVINKIKLFHTETKKLESIYQQKLIDLEELKKSILQMAFAGEL